MNNGSRHHHQPPSSAGGSGSARDHHHSRQSDDEKDRIVRSCFSRVDESNNLMESYITHVKVTEDSYYPSMRPPQDSPDKNKKRRVIIVAVRKSGRVRVHKARENSNGTFQIGKSWNLDELTKIEGDVADASAFIMHMGKPYYWVTNTPRERSVFVSSAIKIYKRYTGGKIPDLVNLEGPSSTSSASGQSQVQSQPQQPPQPQPTHQNHPQLQPPATLSRSQPTSQNSSQTNLPKASAKSSSHPHLPGQPQTPPLGQNQNQGQNQGFAYPPTQAPPASLSPPGATATTSGVAIGAAATTAAAASLNHSPGHSITSVSSGHSLPPPNFSHNRSPSNASRSSTPSQQAVPSQSQHRKRPSMASTTSTDMPPPRTSSHSQSQSHAVPQVMSPPPPGPQQMSTSAPPRELPSQMQPPPTIVEPERSPSDPEISRDIPGQQSSGEFRKGHRKNRSSIHDIKVFARPPSVSDPSQITGNEDDLVALAQASSQVENDILQSLQVDKSEIELESESQAHPQPEQLVEERSERGDVVAELSGHARHKSKSSVASNQSLTARERKKLSFSAESNASAVEETLGEFNWTGRDDSRSLELNISSELAAIEAANTHNVVDLDDRLDDIDQILEDAVQECERLDTILAFFSVQLGSFGDDVRHIEGQGKGIQVQTNHQKDLWNELHRILKTVSLSDDLLRTLKSGRFDSIKDLNVTESALVELYRALIMSGSNHGSNDSMGSMRAIQEKRHIYEQTRNEFGNRFKQFVDMKFKQAMQEADNLMPPAGKSEEPTILPIERPIMKQIYPLTAIMLYMREIDDVTYESILKMYEYCVKPFYENALASFMAKWRRSIANLLTKTQKFSFASTKTSSSSDGIVSKSLKRSGTLARLKSNDSKESKSPNAGNGGGSATGGSANGGSEDASTWTPNLQVRAQIKQSLSSIMENLSNAVINQQEVLVQVFHLSSFGSSGFPDFVKRKPVSKRGNGVDVISSASVREIESDVQRGKEMLMHISMIFGTLQEDWMRFVDFLIKNSSLECPYYLALIEISIAKFETTNQDFLIQVLKRLKDKITMSWQSFVREQLHAISNTLVSSKKRKGVVYFVKILPRFCHMIEEDLKELSTPEYRIKDLSVRQTIDDSYEKIFKEVFQNLRRIAKEPTMDTAHQTGQDQHEDKEQLNYHIMMIENMNVLKEGLVNEDNAVLMSYRGNAMYTYKTELDLYIKTVIRRPLGRILDYLEAVEALLAKSPNENPSMRSTYNRSNVKRLLAGFDAKELRKGVDALFKRVEKHFWGEAGDESKADKDPQLVNKVWSAIGAEYSSIFSRLIKILDGYYKDSETSGGSSLLEVTKADVSAAFARR